MELQGEPALGVRDLVRTDATGQLHDIRCNLAIVKQAVGLADTPAIRIAHRTIAHLILNEPARAAQLPQAVEVADQRHVGIAGIGRARLASQRVRFLCRAEESQVGLQHDGLRAPSLGGNANVDSWIALLGGMHLGEE